MIIRARLSPWLAGGLAGSLAASLALGGCAALSSPGSDGQLKIAAAFYPLQFVAQRVAGPRAEVDDLTQPGTEPHDLELSFKETAQVADADLVVYERDFQPSVDDAVDQTAEGDVLDAGGAVGLEDYADGQTNPHFWQDPLKMARLADAVAARLAEIEPGHAAEFRARAQRLRADLESLDAAYSRGLRGCARNTVVVSHDAFGYLARYGLSFEPILGLSPDAEPTPADLARLQGLIRSDGITTVFSETLVSPKTADTLAADMGVRSGVLDPIEGLSDRTADRNYLSLMRSNLTALQEANGC